MRPEAEASGYLSCGYGEGQEQEQKQKQEQRQRQKQEQKQEQEQKQQQRPIRGFFTAFRMTAEERTEFELRMET